MELFDIKGRVIVITGGYGILGSSMARCLAHAGAHVVIVGRNEEKGQALVKELTAAGTEALFCQADVLDREQLEKAKEDILAKFGHLDVLINAAGGNMPGATIAPGQTIFDLNMEHFAKVTDLNLNGTVLPTLVFAGEMVRQKKGSVINVSSMSAQGVITRVVGYSAAKAAIDNFTRWMAVEMAKKYGVPLVVRSSLNNSEGTVVKEEVTVERMLISGVALDTDAVRIAVIGLKDSPGVAFKLFDTLAKKNINVDMILQSIGRAGTKDISFTVDKNDLDDAMGVLESNQARIGYDELHAEKNIAKLSIVGAGMMSNPGVAAKMFESLYNEGVNINMIATSEIRVTVLINEKDGVRAMNAVHDAFNLAD